MGCDIHTHVEVQDAVSGQWKELTDVVFRHEEYEDWKPITKPFDWRDYGLFAFLTGGEVRNYSGISTPFKPRGLPDDVTTTIKEEEGGYHHASWLTVKELLEFPYDDLVEDRRYTKQLSYGYDCAATCEPGRGKTMTWKEFLGLYYFRDLGVLMSLGKSEDVRVVFYFDC